jgi:hypothetical protein
VRVLLGHIKFADFAGTETYMFTVAQALERLGHEAIIYGEHGGPMAEFARSRGVTVIDNAGRLPADCGAAIAQDAALAHEFAGRYPDAARLMVVHSAYPLQTPPVPAGVLDAVIVLNDRLQRYAQALASPAPVVRLRQPVNVRRFSQRGTHRGRHKRLRVLALNNHPDGPHRPLLTEACRRADVELLEVGALAEPSPTPEHEITGADAVITLGRGALEAMSCARAVYVHGPAGGDGWVTPDAYPEMEGDGFSGRATPLRVDIDQLASDLAGFDEGMGSQNRDLVWMHHSSDVHAAKLVELIDGVTTRPAAPLPQSEELARLVRLEWNSSAQLESALAHNRLLREENETLRRQAQSGRDQVEYLTAELKGAWGRVEAMQSTRRYRLAAGLAVPLDKLRGRE